MEEPKGPGPLDWLIEKFRRAQNKTGVQGGIDGPTSQASSGLTPGQGVNKTPDLTSGASGGGTNPTVDPKNDTV